MSFQVIANHMKRQGFGEYKKAKSPVSERLSWNAKKATNLEKFFSSYQT